MKLEWSVDDFAKEMVEAEKMGFDDEEKKDFGVVKRFGAEKLLDDKTILAWLEEIEDEE